MPSTPYDPDKPLFDDGYQRLACTPRLLLLPNHDPREASSRPNLPVNAYAILHPRDNKRVLLVDALGPHHVKSIKSLVDDYGCVIDGLFVTHWHGVMLSPADVRVAVVECMDRSVRNAHSNYGHDDHSGGGTGSSTAVLGKVTSESGRRAVSQSVDAAAPSTPSGGSGVRSRQRQRGVSSLPLVLMHPADAVHPSVVAADELRGRIGDPFARACPPSAAESSSTTSRPSQQALAGLQPKRPAMQQNQQQQQNQGGGAQGGSSAPVDDAKSMGGGGGGITTGTTSLTATDDTESSGTATGSSSSSVQQRGFLPGRSLLASYGLTPIHMPGHTAGSTMLLLDPCYRGDGDAHDIDYEGGGGGGRSRGAGTGGRRRSRNRVLFAGDCAVGPKAAQSGGQGQPQQPSSMTSTPFGSGSGKSIRSGNRPHATSDSHFTQAVAHRSPAIFSDSDDQLRRSWLRWDWSDPALRFTTLAPLHGCLIVAGPDDEHGGDSHATRDGGSGRGEDDDWQQQQQSCMQAACAPLTDPQPTDTASLA